MADLRGGARDASPPWVSKFFRFHTVLGKIWQNRVLATPHPLEGWRPHLDEILDPPLMPSVLFAKMSTTEHLIQI